MAAPATKTLYVRFNGITNATGYRVYGGTNLNRATWTLLAESTSTNIPILTPVPGFGFIGVKAFNAADESDWATTDPE